MTDITKLSDKELLELTAKVSGINGEWSEQGKCIVIEAWEPLFWNPLENDGDAFRLEIDLDILSGYIKEENACFAFFHAERAEDVRYIRVEVLSDWQEAKRAACRLAITRCAALVQVEREKNNADL